jgi:hypothetical protein
MCYRFSLEQAFVLFLSILPLHNGKFSKVKKSCTYSVITISQNEALIKFQLRLHEPKGKECAFILHTL